MLVLKPINGDEHWSWFPKFWGDWRALEEAAAGINLQVVGGGFTTEFCPDGRSSITGMGAQLIHRGEYIGTVYVLRWPWRFGNFRELASWCEKSGARWFGIERWGNNPEMRCHTVQVSYQGNLLGTVAVGSHAEEYSHYEKANLYL